MARSTSAADGCSSLDVEADEEARKKLWDARHDAALAIRDLYPGMGMMTTDVCNPISDFPGALQRGGTCTGEHSIGLGKTGHLQREQGDSLPLMREIKEIADPNCTMNPGKIFSHEQRRKLVALDSKP